MMYVLSGAVISKNDGRRFTYFQRCDSCSWVHKNVSHTQPVLAGNSESRLGRFSCQKCGADNIVVIGSSKDQATLAVAPDRGHMKRRSSKVANGRQSGGFVGWIIKMLVRTAIFLGIVVGGALFLNDHFNILTQSQNRSVEKYVIQAINRAR